MKNKFINFISFIFLVIGISNVHIAQAQQPRYDRNADRQTSNLLTSIEAKTNAYKSIVSRNNRGGYNNRNNDITNFVADFQTATGQLRQRLNSRQQISSADIEDVLNRANFIENYMRNNRQSSSSQSQWDSIKTDLNSLARNYNVSWNWDNTTNPNQNYPNQNYPNQNNSGGSRGLRNLTGTYRLNISQSDDVRTTIDRALNNNTSNQRDRLRQNLERRLNSPDTLVIERVNRQITFASSTSPQIVVNADGVARSEQNANGRTVNIKTEVINDGVQISYEGDRRNDFYVTFDPLNNGQLKVTRRIYLENQNETITVSSVYDKVSQTANWSETNYNPNTGSNTNNQNYDDFLIPNGTKINAILTSQLSTKSSVDGDKFSMEVRSPSQYQGALIEGHISSPQSSGRVTGRAELSLVFDRIILRDGRTYRYSGLIDDVRTSDGNKININNEGAVRDGNQTTKTVTRAGIGAGIGAIIGAIAGGGQGAAIGAAIGAGAGAGSVVLQGRDNLELNSGTEFNLTSSAPSNLRSTNNR